MINYNSMTKLKTTKFFIIGSRMIINNKKQMDYKLTNLKRKDTNTHSLKKREKNEEKNDC